MANESNRRVPAMWRGQAGTADGVDTVSLQGSSGLKATY